MSASVAADSARRRGAHCGAGLEWSAVPGLERLWAGGTRRGPSLPADEMRLLLSALGLGLEQTIRFLGFQQPTRDEFSAWIIDTAGVPDPEVLDRYRAAVAGEPMPAPTKARLTRIDAADPVLDDDAVAGWARDGYVVLRQAISREEASAAAHVLWAAIGARPDEPDSWYRPREGRFWIPVFQHPALEAARRSPRVHKAFAQLWGTADLWMTVDQMSFNPTETAGATFQGSPLHWDVSLARPIPFATQAILYLSDTPATGGGLQVVPGFHHRLDAWLDALGDADPRSVDLSAEAVAIPAAQGDLVIWRQDLPHGASPNRARHPRLAQYLNMFPASLRSHSVWR